MKHIVFIVALFALLSWTHCDTVITTFSIAGNATFTKSGSPYLIQPQGNVLTIQGSLLIERGVVVNVNPFSAISVTGGIYSVGTKEEPIMLTGSNWYGISVSEPVVFAFTTFENIIGEALQRATSSSQLYTITDCNFTRVKSVHVNSVLVDMTNFNNVERVQFDYSIVANSTFKHVDGVGMFSSDIDNNTFIEVTSVSTSRTLVTNCQFKNITVVSGAYSYTRCSFDAIVYIAPGDAADFNNCIFRSGAKKIFYTGIYNSTFLESTQDQPFDLQDYGYGGYGTGGFNDNIVFNASITLYYQSGKPFENNIFYNINNSRSTLLIKATNNFIFQNNIFMNVGSDTILESPYGSGILKAGNNYWDGTNTTVIDSMRIYDVKDDATLMFVAYTPFKTSVEIPQFILNFYNRTDSIKDEYDCGGLQHCSLQGECVGPNQCSCHDGWTSANCGQPTCGWTNSFGAPTPQVTVTYNQEYIVFEVTMKNNPTNTKLQHYISENRLEPEGVQLALNQSSEQELSSTICETKYRVNVPWNSKHVRKIILADETLQVTSDIWIYYILDSSIGSYIEFSTTQLFNIKLRSTAFAFIGTVAANGDWGMELYRLTNDEHGSIRIHARLTIADTSYTLNSLTFLNSTSPTELLLEYSSTAQSRVYDVFMTPVDSTTSLNGQYYLQAGVIHFGRSLNYTISFSLYYDIILPNPPSNLTIETMITVHKSLDGPLVQTPFEYGQTPFIRTSLKPNMPQLSAGQQLRLQDAYVCCMRNNGAMPIYDPVNGQFGCTVYNPESMDQWSQLVQSGFALSMSAQIYSSDTRSTVFSFNIDLLTEVKRTCYIHVSTKLNNPMRRSITEDGNEESISYSAFTIEARENAVPDDSTVRGSSYTDHSGSAHFNMSWIIMTLMFLFICVW